ncbi:hypothetical protein FORC48_2574 [Bacillus cereus]|nr:hypothetical protein FORC48_2574 [Bacillus cereus]
MVSAYQDLDLINCNKSVGGLYRNAFREIFIKKSKMQQ